MLNETVAAISTARGKGGVAMIRISGDNALSVAQKVFANRSKDKEPTPRKCYYGDIKRDGVIIDDATLTYFKAPYSFTGEDVCEICCHGGIYVTQAVLECVLSNGAKMAGPGEFTKRAYINGKLSLTRAEAIGNVIDAKTDAQLRLASSQARGVLSDKLKSIREQLIAIISRVYATIDYPDEDIEEIEREKMISLIEDCHKEIEKIKNSYKTGRAVAEGIKTAIVGKPNAGKSSVYNMILGEDAAIVTDIAGTTRDIIESTVSLGDVTVRMADTAGIREAKDEVEKIGVEKAKKKIEDSELLFCVFDESEKENSFDEFILESTKDRCSIAIINKIDKQKKMSDVFLQKILSSYKYAVYLSAKEKSGIDELSRCVSRIYNLGETDISTDAVLSNARQFSAVSVSYERIGEALKAIKSGETNDIVCYSLESALSEIEMIDNRNVSEEIVNEIFSHFCVGK